MINGFKNGKKPKKYFDIEELITYIENHNFHIISEEELLNMEGAEKIKNDEYFDYLSKVRLCCKRNEKKYRDTDEHNFYLGQLTIANFCYDNYLFYLEIKYKIGRGVGYDK